jgi:hypothetical protein
LLNCCHILATQPQTTTPPLLSSSNTLYRSNSACIHEHKSPALSISAPNKLTHTRTSLQGCKLHIYSTTSSLQLNSTTSRLLLPPAASLLLLLPPPRASSQSCLPCRCLDAGDCYGCSSSVPSMSSRLVYESPPRKTTLNRPLHSFTACYASLLRSWPRKLAAHSGSPLDGEFPAGRRRYFFQWL